MSTKGIVSLSGGLDSTSVLAYAVDMLGHQNVTGVSFHYGQKHSVELEQAKKIADFYGINHMLIEMPKVFGAKNSTLIEGGPDNPEVTYKEIEEAHGVSPTYVPYRNGNFLSVATAALMTIMSEEDGYVSDGDSSGHVEPVDGLVFAGMHAEDARGWAYPDCTPEFIGAMANAIYIGSYMKVRLVAPLMNMMKSDVIKFGLKYNAPLDLTHSCYNGVAPACGLCPTCVERIESFKKVGLIDPIDYVIDIDWSNCLSIKESML